MRLHNTSSGQVEPFAPADGKKVRMYVCGPTVYAPPHLGHARSAVVYDTLRRRFAGRGWRVQHVMNFTDMAEEIAHKARQERGGIRQTARRYALEYLADMRKLNVQRPTHITWASKFMSPMREDIATLLASGRAYTDGPNVFFDTHQGAPLGLVSRIGFQDATVGAPPITARRDPADFVIWRDSHDWGECWDAPWGGGRPGWHNQCTAMALRTAGPTLDLHGGGIDLAFPHHDSEAAVARALTGKPLSRFWVHHGHVTVWKEKMSKSRGNFVLARDATRRHGPGATRLFLLSKPYREPLDYHAEEMEPWEQLAKDQAQALRALAKRAGRARGDSSHDAFAEAFDAALDEDLDTPRAIALLRGELDGLGKGPIAPAEAASALKGLQSAGKQIGL
ncbi:MAG: class I tRNA ligase family protein [Halobacteriales archaeon]|nr:class I tRNA ligase family protein [Halobacteriales archaeon]